MAATVLLTCAGFLAISVFRLYRSQTERLERFRFEHAPGVERSETPPRRRSSRNSLAAYSLGGSVKPAGRNMKSWLAVLQ